MMLNNLLWLPWLSVSRSKLATDVVEYLRKEQAVALYIWLSQDSGLARDRLAGSLAVGQ